MFSNLFFIFFKFIFSLKQFLKCQFFISSIIRCTSIWCKISHRSVVENTEKWNTEKWINFGRNFCNFGKIWSIKNIFGQNLIPNHPNFEKRAYMIFGNIQDTVITKISNFQKLRRKNKHAKSCSKKCFPSKIHPKIFKNGPKFISQCSFLSIFNYWKLLQNENNGIHRSNYLMSNHSY